MKITQETRLASEAAVNKAKRYEQIKKTLIYAPESSAKEVAVIMYQNGWTPSPDRNYSAPRLTELEEKGIVEIVGTKRCGYTGRTVAVYALKEDANEH